MKARILSGALAAILLAACGTDAPSTTTVGEPSGHGDRSESPAVPRLRSAEEPEHAAPLRKLRADGLLPGMVRFRGDKSLDANPICNNPQLTYFGGPLLQSPTIVAVFWTDTVNATEQANIAQFYADVTTSSYWSWLQEYDSVGLNPGTNQ